MVQISTAERLEPVSKASLRQLEILEAASRVFRQRGLHATGMREIAAECGMQVGNLYYYFESKQELLAFCQRHTLEGLLELTHRTRELGLRSDTELYLLVHAHVVRLNRQMPGSLAHLEIEALEPKLRRPILRQRDRYESSIRAVVETGIATKIFRPTEAKVATMALLGAANWTVKWYQPDGPLSSGDIGSQFAEMLVTGLLAPGQSLQLPEPAQIQALGV